MIELKTTFSVMYDHLVRQIQKKNLKQRRNIKNDYFSRYFSAYLFDYNRRMHLPWNRWSGFEVCLRGPWFGL